jgi:uncharacterized membrane protein YqjE
MTDRASPGLLGSLRGLLQNGAELAEVRLELFATELRQEKLRVIESLAWLGVAMLALSVGLVLLGVFLVLLVGEPYRLAALGVVTALYLAGAWFAWQRARARRRLDSPPFAASLAELRRDRAMLTGQPAPDESPR